MKRFIDGADRGQSTLFPECVEDWIGEDNPVRVIDVLVDGLDLAELGFGGVDPEATGRPSYHPSMLLKLCIYGYLNQVQSSRRLEREAGRNVEVTWLLGRLAPDHKTIADFRKPPRLCVPPRISPLVTQGVLGPFPPDEPGWSCDCTGWLKLHESGTSVKFTAAGAELFALKKGRPVPAKFAAAIPTRNESTPNGVESSGVH